MAVDYPSTREKVFDRFPFMRSDANERRTLFDRNQVAIQRKTASYEPNFQKLRVEEPFPQSAVA
jgi:hypothetical protein